MTTTPPRVLIADDEVNLRRVLSAILAREGYEVLSAGDGEQAWEQLALGVDVVITDLRMPRVDGMELLRRVVSEHPQLPVIIVTAHGSVDSAVEAVKLGAFDYIEKPFEQEQILEIVDKAVRSGELARRDPRPLGGGTAPGRFGLVGQSAALNQIFQMVEKVADSPSTVLVSGESGTGKELIAKALHRESTRCGEPFIKIHCAAIPKTLIESELFGYEKGAFTGALSAKPGRFELAHRGTLFLDEIGEVPGDMQVKLLRVLQEGEFERVGGLRTIRVDVRLVAATNRDLERETRAGNFREDLYYRLNVVPIRLPPLRERREDIPLLARFFVSKFNERLKRTVSDIDEQAMARLEAYSWPGNIRELENVLERTMLFCEHPVIGASDLPEEIGPPLVPVRVVAAERPASGDSRPVVACEGIAAGPTPSPPAASPARSVRVSGPPGDSGEPETQGAGEAQPEGATPTLREIVRRETDRVERELIVQALEETAGNVTHAARRLGISRKSLQIKMKEFGLRSPE